MLSDEVSDDGRDAERVEFGLRSRWGDHVGRSSIGKPSRKWSIPDSNLTFDNSDTKSTGKPRHPDFDDSARCSLVSLLQKPPRPSSTSPHRITRRGRKSWHRFVRM